MKTLIIIPEHFQTRFRMKGLSVRKVRELCIDETGYYIDSRSKTNPRTCKIDAGELVKFLNELKEEIPFDKITIKGHYEKTGDELMFMLD
jgi:hypothetical protein